MEPTTKQFIAELQKQQIADKYHPEGFQIIKNYITNNHCSLEVAIKFVLKWMNFNELLLNNTKI